MGACTIKTVDTAVWPHYPKQASLANAVCV